LERTTLGEVSVFIKEVYSPNGWYVDVKLDKDAIQQLFLGIDSATYGPGSVLLWPQCREGGG
jgi:DNA-directed RNA polymerase III subunit RPC1